MKKSTSAGDYHILSLEVAEKAAEALAEEYGARLGLSPVQFTHPGQRSVWVEFYFDRPGPAQAAARDAAADRRVRAARVRLCPARDWQSFWRRHFTALDVAGALRIRPTWERRRRPPAGVKELRINPGLSFGTGQHFTTRFCLEATIWICRAAHPRSMLDIGAGSGILAMTAVRFGCTRAVALDNDPLAVEAMRENLRSNRLTPKIRADRADILAAPPRGRYDLVCANLHAGLLEQCAADIARAARGHLVVSGLREFETDAAADRFAALGGREIQRDGDGEWSGLVFRFV